MIESILTLESVQPGPISMILVGVHGNERCGIDALEKLIPSLEVSRGKVFVAYGNPRAIEKDIRFTEANLNRMFKPDESLTDKEKQSYEYGRAQFLKTYLNQSEVLLDIHASATPESKRFLICEPNAKDIAKNLPFEKVVSGFDQVEPGGTDYYMNRIGKIGICAECGDLKDSASTQVAEETILAFLRTRGHIDGTVSSRVQSNINMCELYVTKTDSFVLAKPFADFEPISVGQIIGMDGDEKVIAKKDGLILFARNRTAVGEEGFLLGEPVLN